MKNLKLKMAIVQSGIPAYKIAEQLGISASTISKFISGIQKPKNVQVEQIASIIGVKEEDIL